MNEGHVSTTALPESHGVGARHSGWTAGRITALVIGSLVVLFSLVLLGAGGTGVWADRTQREAGYVTTGVHRFSTSTSAITTERTRLGSVGVGWLYAPGLLDSVRIRVTPVHPGSALFVGIGPSAAVDRYLAGVQHTVVADFWKDEVELVDGGTAVPAPETQDFWVASDIGSGARELVWSAEKGSWTVVVMNADGRPGLDVDTDLGARLPAVLWVSLGVLAGGAIFFAGGALLITGAIRAGRARA